MATGSMAVVDQVKQLISETGSSDLRKVVVAAIDATKLIREYRLVIAAPENGNSGNSTRNSDRPPAWGMFTPRHWGQCITCRESIEPGQRCWYKRDVGMHHLECQRPAGV